MPITEEQLASFQSVVVRHLEWMWEHIPDGFDVCSVFAIAEFSTNCFAQIGLFLAIRSISADINLHGNFKWNVHIIAQIMILWFIRFVLCMALSRTFLNGVRRTVANYLTLFWTDQLSEEFLVCISRLFHRHNHSDLQLDSLQTREHFHSHVTRDKHDFRDNWAICVYV